MIVSSTFSRSKDCISLGLYPCHYICVNLYHTYGPVSSLELCYLMYFHNSHHHHPQTWSLLFFNLRRVFFNWERTLSKQIARLVNITIMADALQSDDKFAYQLVYILVCVSKIKHILSVIHYTIYGAVCFQFTHFPCDDWENIYFVLLS